MLLLRHGSADPVRPRSIPPVEFYLIELMPLADGHLRVGVSATICEPLPGEEFELVNMEVASQRVRTFDEALAVIRSTVSVQ